MKTEPNEFVIYDIGLYYVSVCTSLAADEVAGRMNLESPTGIAGPWKLSEDPTFRGGEPNPCPCDQHPETRKHFLLSC